LIAGYLARRIEGKVILDLNCGRTPLFPFLPRTFDVYVGNTADPEAARFLKQVYPGGTWVQCLDVRIPDMVRVDVLLCLGWEVGREGRREATVDETVMGLVFQYYPEMVILESEAETPKREEFDALVEWVVEQGYSEVGMWEVRPWQSSSGVVTHRGVVILERGSGRKVKPWRRK